MASQKKIVGLDGLRMSPGLPLIERRKILGTLTLQSEWVKIADYFEVAGNSTGVFGRFTPPSRLLRLLQTKSRAEG